MQQSPANLCSVNLSGCFVKLLVSSASWGKVLQSLITRCVKSLCLFFVFHLLPPLLTLCPGSCPEGTVLPLCPVCSPHDTRVWFMDLCPTLTPSFHFQSILFSDSWWGSWSTPLIILVTFCWTFPSSNISFLASEGQNCTGYSRCSHMRNIAVA